MEEEFAKFAAGQASDLVADKFQELPSSFQLGTIAGVIWFVGAIFKIDILFLAGVIVSLIASLFGFIEITSSSKYSNSLIGRSSFTAVFWAIINHFIYFSLFSSGPVNLAFFGLDVPLEFTSQISIAYFLIVWLLTKYVSPSKWNYEFNNSQYVLLFIIGLTNGFFILLLIDSFLFKLDIVLEYYYVVIAVYLLNPILEFFFAYTQRIVSSSTLAFSKSKLPFSALMTSLVYKFLFVLITVIIHPELGDKINSLLAVFFIALIFALWQYIREGKYFKKNPFKRSILNTFFNSYSTGLETDDISDSLTNVITNSLTIKNGKISNIKLQKGNVILPIKNIGNKLNILVFGNSSSLTQNKFGAIEDSVKGILALQVTKKEFKKIINGSVQKKFSNLNFGTDQLPSYEEVTELVNLFSNKISGWISDFKNSLTKFSSVAGAGVIDNKDFTKVNIPGIFSVFNSDKKNSSLPKFAKLKFIGGTVLGVPEKIAIVKILGITVFDWSNKRKKKRSPNKKLETGEKNIEAKTISKSESKKEEIVDNFLELDKRKEENLNEISLELEKIKEGLKTKRSNYPELPEEDPNNQEENLGLVSDNIPRSMTFVDVANLITVIDLGKIVQHVKINLLNMSFDANSNPNNIEQLNTEEIWKLRKRILEEIDKYLGIYDSAIDKILGDKFASGTFKIGWDREFTPVISSSSRTITDDRKIYNALPASQFIGKSKEMLAGEIEKMTVPPKNEVNEANYEVVD